MALKPEFSPRSLQDLQDILEYIAQDKPRAAHQFVALLRKKCDLLVRSPGMGVSRHSLYPGFRMFPVGRYNIYYRPVGDTVRIERVLHSSRDPETLLRRILGE